MGVCHDTPPYCHFICFRAYNIICDVFLILLLAITQEVVDECIKFGDS